MFVLTLLLSFSNYRCDHFNCVILNILCSSQYFKVEFRIFVEKKIEKKKKYLTNITIHNYNYIYMSIVIYT